MITLKSFDSFSGVTYLDSIFNTHNRTYIIQSPIHFAFKIFYINFCRLCSFSLEFVPFVHAPKMQFSMINSVGKTNIHLTGSTKIEKLM